MNKAFLALETKKSLESSAHKVFNGDIALFTAQKHLP